MDNREMVYAALAAAELAREIRARKVTKLMVAELLATDGVTAKNDINRRNIGIITRMANTALEKGKDAILA